MNEWFEKKKVDWSAYKYKSDMKRRKKPDFSMSNQYLIGTDISTANEYTKTR